MSFAVQAVVFATISLLSGSLLFRQYRLASAMQRRQIVLAGISAAALAVGGVLILVFR